MARREIIECDWCGEEIASEDNVIRVDDNDVCSWECVVRLAIQEHMADAAGAVMAAEGGTLLRALERAEVARELAEYMGVSEKTVRNRVKEHGGFEIEGSTVKLMKSSGIEVTNGNGNVDE